MERLTHLALDPTLSGRPVELAAGRAVVELDAGPRMAADDRGLVHGGFVFSLADHAAMLAINHPNVVLGSASVRFLRPVVVGDRLHASARRRRQEGKKEIVEVEVKRGDEVVMSGEFTCFIPPRHVLDRRPT
ncbi:MAG: thioesterase [Acidobacteria bacterium]|nr:MAG: thioesterase [Acidobacteriota bacterium]